MYHSRKYAGIFLVALLSVASASCGDGDISGLPEQFSERDAAAEDLFRIYSDALVAKQDEVLAALIGEEFLIQRTDGSWADRESFLASIPDLRSFQMTDVTERRGKNMVVARFIAQAEVSIDGESYPLTPAPMLAAFKWSDGQWSLVAQANFNQPRQ